MLPAMLARICKTAAIPRLAQGVLLQWLRVTVLVIIGRQLLLEGYNLPLACQTAWDGKTLGDAASGVAHMWLSPVNWRCVLLCDCAHPPVVEMGPSMWLHCWDTNPCPGMLGWRQGPSCCRRWRM
jgi:hypothetical protein